MSLINLNLLKLRAQARSKSGVNANNYSNSLLDDQLNIAYVQLATMLANLGEDYFEEQNVKFDLVANSGLYSLPTDFMAFKCLRLAYSGTPIARSAYVIATGYDPSEVYDIATQEANIPVSNPLYDLTNNYVRIKPKPTQAVSAGGSMDYIALPSALAATSDVPIIPVQYHDKIATYGAAQMAFKFEKWNKYERLNGEWQGVMTDLENKIAERDLTREVRFKSPFEAGAVIRNGRPREL